MSTARFNYYRNRHKHGNRTFDDAQERALDYLWNNQEFQNDISDWWSGTDTDDHGNTWQGGKIVPPGIKPKYEEFRGYFSLNPRSWDPSASMTELRDTARQYGMRYQGPEYDIEEGLY